jgi:hypothetical protein
MEKEILEAERRNLDAHIFIGAIDNFLKRPEILGSALYVQSDDAVGALDAADSAQGLHPGKIDRSRQSSHFDNLAELGTAQQLVESADRDQLPFAQDSQSVAQSLRFFHVVRGVQNRIAVIAQAANDFQDLFARLRIDAGGRLVEQDEFRPMYQ